MSVGDRARVIRVSSHLPEAGSVYEKCVGHVFTVAGFDGDGWVELDVGSVTGQAFEMIVIEPECLEIVEESVLTPATRP